MGEMSFRRLRVPFCLCLTLLLLILLDFSTLSFANDLSEQETQEVIKESMQDLFTGKDFPPVLEKKQIVMREMLKNGSLRKETLTAMIEKIIVSVLNENSTSRYILKEIPERINALLSPYTEWEEMKEIVWRACSKLIADGEQLVIKMGTLAPSGTPWLNVPETILIPRMAKFSNNKVVIKIFGGGVMGEDTDILRKMDIGQLEGCGCTALGILAASPETSALLLPGMFRNYDEVDYITEKFRQRLDSYFMERGYILAAIIDTGFFCVFSKNKISGLADLKKQKVLTWFGIVETALYDELGIDATPVAVPEVASALSTGLADTCLAPSAWMLGMQAYQYTNYYIRPAMLYSPAAVVVSVQLKDRFQEKFGLSETLANNLTEMLVYEVNDLETHWRQQVRVFEEKSLKAFEVKCGMKPVQLSSEDQEILEKASLAVREKLSGKAFPKDFMEEMFEELDAYRALGAER